MLRRPRTITAAALSALVILSGSALSGCATEITGSATAGTIPTSSAAEEPSDSEEPTEAVESSGAVESSEAAEQTEADSAESAGAAASSSSTESAAADPSEDPVPPVEPSEADADTAAWFGAFCIGYNDLTSYSSPDVTGMSDEAALQTIVDAYTSMAQIGYDTADRLGSVAPPHFTGAEAVVPAVTHWFSTVGDVYSAGASAIAGGSFADGDQLTAQIDQIESGLDGVNQSLGGAMGLLDADTRQIVKDLPECAALVGG